MPLCLRFSFKRLGSSEMNNSTKNARHSLRTCRRDFENEHLPTTTIKYIIKKPRQGGQPSTFCCLLVHRRFELSRKSQTQPLRSNGIDRFRVASERHDEREATLRYKEAI